MKSSFFLRRYYGARFFFEWFFFEWYSIDKLHGPMASATRQWQFAITTDMMLCDLEGLNRAFDVSDMPMINESKCKIVPPKRTTRINPKSAVSNMIWYRWWPQL